MVWSFDRRLVLTIILLFGIGLVQVYSASFMFALESYGDSLYFFRRQCFFVALGVVALFFCAFLPWSFYQKYGVFLWFASAALLALTFVPGIGVKVGGGQRWIQLPVGFRFEPVEMLKVAVPFMFIQFVRWDTSRVRSALAWLCLLVPIVALLKQPDFGSFVIILSILFLLFFSFGLYLKTLAATVIASLPAFHFLVMQVPYRKARVLAFLDPWADPEQKGFQTIQSLLGFHNGGITGVGLGQGQAKLFFLPEAHTDFTLSVWGEEMGFVGFVFLLVVYGYLVYRGFKITWTADRIEEQSVSLGLTLLFAFSVFINIGVVLGVLPAKGLTLPFLSYGGSSLVSLSIAAGILISLEREVNQSHNLRPTWQRFALRSGS